MDKIDFKKVYKEVFNVKKNNIITFPKSNYITISGIGDPNTDNFKNAIEALYSIAYTISMSYKNNFYVENFKNFVVSPLIGDWDLIDHSHEYDGNKNNLAWNIKLMMPDFVSNNVFKEAQSKAFLKKKNELINNVVLTTENKFLCCINLHIGSYDNEANTFSSMEEFAFNNGYFRSEKTHREIYISDFRKTETNKLKTVLIFKVSK